MQRRALFLVAISSVMLLTFASRPSLCGLAFVGRAADFIPSGESVQAAPAHGTAVVHLFLLSAKPAPETARPSRITDRAEVAGVWGALPTR